VAEQGEAPAVKASGELRICTQAVDAKFHLGHRRRARRGWRQTAL